MVVVIIHKHIFMMIFVNIKIMHQKLTTYLLLADFKQMALKTVVN